MQDITKQRCHNHLLREAVARCPGCGHFFCRECITEHEDKVLCAACLGRGSHAVEEKLQRFQWIFRLGHFFLGILIAYVLFFYLAQMLLLIPTSFHEGTFWQTGWWKGP